MKLDNYCRDAETLCEDLKKNFSWKIKNLFKKVKNQIRTKSSNKAYDENAELKAFHGNFKMILKFKIRNLMKTWKKNKKIKSFVKFIIDFNHNPSCQCSFPQVLILS